MTRERWKHIPGFGGYYEVSDRGRVRSINTSIQQKNGVIRRHRPRIIKPSKTKSGHQHVKLYAEGRKIKKYIHSLVLEAFVGPRPYGHSAAHNDGNPSNNIPLNLRWATAKENAQDRILHGTNNNGERHGNAILTAEQVLEIRQRHIVGCRVNGARPLAREYGVSHGAIKAILARRSWFHI